jgi:hypothetical protein
VMMVPLHERGELQAMNPGMQWMESILE